MQSIRANEGQAGVNAKLSFCRDDGAAPVTLVNSVGAGLDKRTGDFVPRTVFIRNARLHASKFKLDREGFELTRHDTTVSDFYDDEEVRRIYYPEMEALLKTITGATQALIFDHTRRIDDDGALAQKKARPPAEIVHNDFTITSAEQRVRDLLPTKEAKARLQKRFSSVNVWRAIREPVQTAPLAICEYGTIQNDDLITAERHYPDKRIGRIYNLAFNPKQSWYFFPELMRGETVLLKCYDSLTDGTARWTAHGSFKHPKTSANAHPRESIEIRSMLFFD